MQELAKSQPKLMQAFQGLHHAVGGGGALESKTKELLSLAISIHGQCHRCISLHVASALSEGATPEEITETIGVAVLMGGGPALMHGLDALKALKELD